MNYEMKKGYDRDIDYYFLAERGGRWLKAALSSSNNSFSTGAVSLKAIVGDNV